ncbi:OLC1v1010287C1 [Oldenlandia corymbosa var. corymbosa]|uniref:60S ribosomal export protein NMD3 n=1 Tax=Oldenlandia corymbosa var. corymbosa TaxID=529605 RepID=A0AAV1DR85_OLDCO|nr:OLC1v1010287C1 [Oldenlandia corymbosa var. corymbosa]
MAQAAGIFTVNQTIGSVLCCKCGILMQPNPANMCAKCLRNVVDITAGLQKHVVLVHCPECDSYLQPPRTWLKLQLESKELLTFCVKRLKNLNEVRLVHAEFIWTEPHSKRIKVKLTVQQEVLRTILEQPYTVEYVVHEQMCDSCTRVQANPDQWVASVQLRQHVSHRRTFFHLEQLILKHDASVHCIRIRQVDQGIDFFFSNRSHAVKFVEFLAKVVPVRHRNDKQLVSHDTKSNNYNYKYTLSVEICPICREDLICLPPKVAVRLGNLGPLVICTKISNNVALMDPFTLRHCFLDADQYWRSPFKSLLSSRQLVEYVVLDVEPISSEVIVGGSRYLLADAQVARVSDFGKNDTIFNVRTHLGRVLKPGDNAFGYDLFGANSNDVELDKYKGFVLPDVVLMRKRYEEQLQKRRGDIEWPDLAKLKLHENEDYKPSDDELEIDQMLDDLIIDDEDDDMTE